MTHIELANELRKGIQSTNPHNKSLQQAVAVFARPLKKLMDEGVPARTIYNAIIWVFWGDHHGLTRKRIISSKRFAELWDEIYPWIPNRTVYQREDTEMDRVRRNYAPTHN